MTVVGARFLSAVAIFCSGLLTTPSQAYHSFGGPIPLAFTASECDERASILNVTRPKGRYLSEVSKGVIALLDIGETDETRFQFMIAAYPDGAIHARDGVAFCKIVTLVDPTFGLTDDIYISGSGYDGPPLGSNRIGPSATLSIGFRRLDMKDAFYKVDTVTYLHLDQETGEITFEIRSMGGPKKMPRR